MAKLKVFRTPIGFHDAYVAAPSRKAALEAWGSTADLFARGVAEVVTDPALTAAPMAQPGEVIRVSRGSAAEQLAALPKQAKRPAAKPAAKSKPTAKPKPRPHRAALDEAEAALSAAERRHRAEDTRLAVEEKALADRRRALRTAQAKEAEKLETARVKAARAYDAALAAWRDD